MIVLYILVLKNLEEFVDFSIFFILAKFHCLYMFEIFSHFIDSFNLLFSHLHSLSLFISSI